MTQEGVFLFLFVSTKHAKFISNVPFSIFFRTTAYNCLDLTFLMYLVGYFLLLFLLINFVWVLAFSVAAIASLVVSVYIEFILFFISVHFFNVKQSLRFWC